MLWIGLVLLLAAVTLGAVLLLRGQGEKTVAITEVKNPQLSAGGVNGAPLSWEIKSYENKYVVTTTDGVTALRSEVADDLRVMQKISVSPNTQYVFSCEVKTTGVTTGRGAGLSIDNMDIDRSCVYSQPAQGTSDWTAVELAFTTMAKQTEVNLAMRMGGYSEATQGEASFRNIKLEQTDIAQTAFQQLTPWGDGSNDKGNDKENGETTEKDEYYYKEVFSLFLLAAIIAGVIMVVGFFTNLKRIVAYRLPRMEMTIGVLSILVVGVVLRFVLCAVFRGHETDMSCWISWGNTVANEGPASLYNGWCDYPPGYMAVLGIISKTLSIFGIGSRTMFGLFSYMVPAMLADFGCALLLVHVGRRQGMRESILLVLAGLVALNPAAVVLSGAWGQIDSILTFLLLLSFYCLSRNRRILSGLCFGLAIVFKWQALMFGPVLAVAFLLSIQDMKDLLNTALAVLAAVAAIFLISLPFKGEQKLFWIVDKFMEAQGGYDYASIEAYNFVALIGGNWKATEGTLFKELGWFAIVLSVAISTMIMVLERQRSKKIEKSLSDEPGNLYLAAAFCMYMIFTFGHFMHERYVFPVIFLLLFAYACYGDKRILLAAIFVTATTFLNEMTAMYIVSTPAINIVRGGREHNDLLYACSLAQTVSFLYFVWVCLDCMTGAGKKIRAAMGDLDMENAVEVKPPSETWVKEQSADGQ